MYTVQTFIPVTNRPPKWVDTVTIDQQASDEHELDMARDQAVILREYYTQVRIVKTLMSSLIKVVE